MSFDWIDFLRIAKVFEQDADKTSISDAMYRTAISRAYYASFNSARLFLIDKGMLRSDERENIHYRVIEVFQQDPSDDWRQIGTWLERMRRDRNEADYDQRFRDLSKRCRRTVKRAEELIALLDSL